MFTHRQRKQRHVEKIDWETDFSTDSVYDESANEILFVGNILQPFQFETIFTAAEIQAKKDLIGTTEKSLPSLDVTELDAQPAH